MHSSELFGARPARSSSFLAVLVSLTLESLVVAFACLVSARSTAAEPWPEAVTACAPAIATRIEGTGLALHTAENLPESSVEVSGQIAKVEFG